MGFYPTPHLNLLYKKGLRIQKILIVIFFVGDGSAVPFYYVENGMCYIGCTAVPILNIDNGQANPDPTVLQASTVYSFEALSLSQ